MKIEFTLTFDNFKAAYVLYLKRQLSIRLMFPISVVALVGGILGAVLINDNGPFGWLSPIFAGAIGGGFVGTILLPLFRIYAVRKAFSYFLPKPVEGRVLLFEIDSEKICSEIPGIGSGEIQWSVIHDFAQDEKVTLLYITKKRFYFFPTAAMTPEQRAELNDIVTRHGLRNEK
jgi:uncharacterized membrane protein YeaQ/YmgE (transglycosylase-associated protein family)